MPVSLVEPHNLLRLPAMDRSLQRLAAEDGILYYTGGFMFCYFFVNFFFWPLDPRNSEWTAREFFCEQLGYGVVLLSCDWYHRLVPLFLGRSGNCPIFRQKNVTVPLFAALL